MLYFKESLVFHVFHELRYITLLHGHTETSAIIFYVAVQTRFLDISQTCCSAPTLCGHTWGAPVIQFILEYTPQRSFKAHLDRLTLYLNLFFISEY